MWLGCVRVLTRRQPAGERGQVLAELAVLLPLLLLLLAVVLVIAYCGLAQLLVTSGAGQGARLGASLCAEQVEAEEVLYRAREHALAAVAHLPGPATADAWLEEGDLLVHLRHSFLPPLPGAAFLSDDGLHFTHTARYRCQ